MKTKVELRERFETLILHGTNTTMDRNRLFDLFWDEIEAREKEIKTLTSISHLESLVKEADGIVRQYEMGDLSQFELDFGDRFIRVNCPDEDNDIYIQIKSNP